MAANQELVYHIETSFLSPPFNYKLLIFYLFVKEKFPSVETNEITFGKSINLGVNENSSLNF